MDNRSLAIVQFVALSLDVIQCPSLSVDGDDGQKQTTQRGDAFEDPSIKTEFENAKFLTTL